MHPGMDPEVGYRIDDNYSVTQSLPWDYRYVKWWGSGPILHSGPRRRTTIVGTSSVA